MTISFTSQIISLKIEVCEGITLTSSLASSYKLQIGASFTTVNINAVPSRSDCVMNAGSYLTAGYPSAVTLSSSGAFNIDTTAALASTTLTFTITLGSPLTVTVTSPSFTVEIFDCLALTSVTNMQAVFQVQLNNTLKIDFATVTSLADCVVDASSYMVPTVKTGMNLLSNGTYSVDALTAYAANTIAIVEV